MQASLSVCCLLSAAGFFLPFRGITLCLAASFVFLPNQLFN
jgi:hypothetical protein